MIKANYSGFDPNFDDGKSKYFITYFGDIYYGMCYQNEINSDSFFIVQNNKLHELNSLSASELTTEKMRKFGRQISDKRIIAGIIEGKTEIGSEKGQIDNTRYSGKKWKRMFVFGAGASANCLFGEYKGALYNSEFKPPIGFELFGECYDSIIDKYPGVRDSIPVFQKGGNDIETTLENEWSDLIKSYNPQLVSRHINIQYYLQDLFTQISKHVVNKFWRTNLYSLFATQIQKHLTAAKDECIALVSFNYDTILDSFLEKIFRFNFTNNEDYIDYNNRPLVLLKPHGSCNWGWPFIDEKLLEFNNEPMHQYIFNKQFDMCTIYYQLLGNFSDMVYRQAWGLEMSTDKDGLGRFTYNKNKIKVFDEVMQEKSFPALLLPYRDKDEFLMHYDHQNALRWFSNEIEELYLIGWKGNEDVFNRMLKRNLRNIKKIVIVNPDSKCVIDNLRKYDIINTPPIIIDTFEDFVINHLDKMLNE